MKLITSRDNAVFKRLCRLADNARFRRQQGETLLDGVHLAQSLVDSPHEPLDFMVSATGLTHPEIEACLSAWPHVPVLGLSDELFRLISPVETPSGLLTRIHYPESTGAVPTDRDTLVLDGVQDPGNLGTLLRTAAASGVRQAVLSVACAQAWSPRALRAGMGAQLRLEIHESTDLDAFLAPFSGRRLVTALGAQTSLYDLDLCASPVAWIFGGEGQGVRPAIARLADTTVRIPMPGAQVESLNVAAAAAICLFEMVRQRSLA